MSAQKHHEGDVAPSGDNPLARQAKVVSLRTLTNDFSPSPVVSVGVMIYDQKKSKLGKCLAIGHVGGKEGVRVTMQGRGRGRNHLAQAEDCVAIVDENSFVQRKSDKKWYKVCALSISGASMRLVLQAPVADEADAEHKTGGYFPLRSSLFPST